MTSRHRHTTVVLLALLLSIGLYGASQRPVSVVAQLHTPDDKHIHQVFAENNLSQTLTPGVNSIDGIQFWFAEDSATPADAQITLHVRRAGDEQDIRTVSGPLSQFRDTAQLEYYDETYALLESADTLHFPFERIANSKNQAYDFVLSAAVPARHALRIRYESDEKKFPSGESFSTEGSEQGNLGFVLYERPTIGTLMARWLVDPRHILIWPSLGLIVFGAIFWLRKLPLQPTSYGLAWQDVQWRKQMLWIAAGICVLGIAMYWPATDLYYFHDDLALLARVKHFQGLGLPWKIISAHDYIEADPFSQFSFYFWRPVSALYTWGTWTLAGLNASWAYGANIVLMGITGGGLFLVAYVLLRSRLAAAIAAVAWLSHSTKIGAAYWWSESQDILAGLFAVFSVLGYLAWRKSPAKRWLLAISVALLAAGVLSKEHVFALPLVIFTLAMFEQSGRIDVRMKHAVRVAAPYLLIAGIILGLRTVALGDPTLPYVRRVDDTYAFTTSANQIAQNITSYAAWSAEHWLWPQMKHVDMVLDQWLWRTRLQSPYYPGIVLLAGYTITLVAWRKDSRIRVMILLGGAWWGLFLTPQLLLANDWRFRWLYLAIFGLTLLLGFAFAKLPKHKHMQLGLPLLAVITIYGFWQARVPERTRFYHEQSAYIEAAANQYAAQRDRAVPESRIYLIGVAPQQETSLNAYLFRLLHPYYPLQIVRQNQPPQERELHDIVIDMRGHDPYYPEHER